jgi:integrase
VDELRHLLGKISPTLGLAVESSVYTGCRREETFALTWDRVFFDKGYATVIAKDGNEHRVWLTPNSLDVLGRCDRDKRYVFDRYVFDRRNWRKVWEAGLERAGLADFRWHDLRHVHATWLRQQGVPLEVVQRSMGHKEIATTQRYAHVADRELQEALHKLPPIRPADENRVVSLWAKQQTS